MNKNTGQTLIEAVVSATILIVGLLGIVSLLLSSMKWNRDMAGRLVATYLAAEGIEVIKNIADSNISHGSAVAWNDGLAGDYEVQYDSNKVNLQVVGTLRQLRFDSASVSASGRYGYSGDKETSYTRKVNVLGDETGNKMTVTSVVSWQSRDKTETVKLQDSFYNWRKKD